MTHNPNSLAGQALDRADVRVRQDEGLAGALRGFLDKVRSGDLGMLPVAVGLVVISVVFTSLNPVFVRPGNLSNLLYDCATTGIISLGIVCVLLLGEIDLSVGSMSGLASAILGVLWINLGWPVARRHPRGPRARRRRGRALRRALQPRGDAVLRGDAGGSPGAARTPALPARLDGLDQPALRSASRPLRAEPLHAERAVLRAGVDSRGGCALDRDPSPGATAEGGAYRRRDERPRGQGAGC